MSFASHPFAMAQLQYSPLRHLLPKEHMGIVRSPHQDKLPNASRFKLTLVTEKKEVVPF